MATTSVAATRDRAPELPLPQPEKPRRKVTMVTCGVCGERRPNKGRGLCAEHYLAEYKAGRIGLWQLDRHAMAGRRSGDGAAPADAVDAPAAGLAITVPFVGRDVALYRAVVDLAASERRSLEQQVLYMIEAARFPSLLDTAADVGVGEWAADIDWAPPRGDGGEVGDDDD